MSFLDLAAQDAKQWEGDARKALREVVAVLKWLCLLASRQCTQNLWTCQCIFDISVHFFLVSEHVKPIHGPTFKNENPRGGGERLEFHFSIFIFFVASRVSKALLDFFGGH